jgi:hypothetical protein
MAARGPAACSLRFRLAGAAATAEPASPYRGPPAFCTQFQVFRRRAIAVAYMDSGELDKFLAEVRQRADEMVAQLDTIDRTCLPPIAKRVYDDTRQSATEVLTLTSASVLALLSEACERSGRELTHDELLELLGLR